MARLSLLIDVTKCSGCHNCFLACRDEYYDNDYSPYSAPQPLDGQFWMQVKEVERGSYPKPKLDYIPIPCHALREGSLHRRGGRRGRVPAQGRHRAHRPEEGQGAEGHRQLLPVPGGLLERRARDPAEVHAVRPSAGRRRRASRAASRPARPARWSSATWTIPTARSPRLAAALKTETYHPEYDCSPDGQVRGSAQALHRGRSRPAGLSPANAPRE